MSDERHFPSATRPCARCGIPCSTGGSNAGKSPVCWDCRATDPWWLATTGMASLKAKPVCPTCGAGTYEQCASLHTGERTPIHDSRRQLMRQEQAA